MVAKRRPNDGSVSDRTASTWPSWASTSTVKTTVCQLSAPLDRAQAIPPSDTPPMSSPTQPMCHATPCAKTLSRRGPGRALHDARVGRLPGQGQARQAVGDEVDPQDLQRQ